MRRLWRGWLVLLALTLVTSGNMVVRAYRPHRRAMISVDVPPRQALSSDHTSKPKLLTTAELRIVAARPFSLGHASAVDRARALRCLADAVYYEAGGEPDAGQRAVAQVILNRVRHPVFPATVCGVVYQGSQRGRCQFSFACDGATARLPSRAGWLRAMRIASAALTGHVCAPVGLATYYHTDAVTPVWARFLVMTDMIGAHLFHRWQGRRGTASAFSQLYAGSELVPAPGPATPRATATMLATLSRPPSILPVTVTRGDDVPQNQLPRTSAVLDRWQGSGKPL